MDTINWTKTDTSNWINATLKGALDQINGFKKHSDEYSAEQKHLLSRMEKYYNSTKDSRNISEIIGNSVNLRLFQDSLAVGPQYADELSSRLDVYDEQNSGISLV